MADDVAAGGTREPGAGRPPNGAGPAQLLSDLAQLRRRARRARHAYWFPLVLFGLIICAAAALKAWAAGPVLFGGIRGPRTFARPATGPSVLAGLPPSPVDPYLEWYWALALVGGFLLTWLWYRRHARQAGLVTPARAAVALGVVLAVLALAVPTLTARVVPWVAIGDLWLRGTIALLVVAAGLWALTWSERSRALAVVTGVFTTVAVVCTLYDVSNVLDRLGLNPETGWPGAWLAALPTLLPAAVLLAGGVAAWLGPRLRRPA